MKSIKVTSPIVFSVRRDDIPKELLREFYRTMLWIQKVELKINELYHEDEMKTPVHLCLGQEAVAAGVCLNLNADDYVFTNHRGHGHYIAKGGNVKAMVAEFYNRETGCSRGRGGSMHLVDTAVGLLGSSSIVGGGIPIATGAALASVLRKDNRVSLAFFGDAAVEEGVIYESINFAMLKKLPVVYVCENNLYSVYTHIRERQPQRPLTAYAEAHGMPSMRVDGNDVLVVREAAQEMVDRARQNEGPSLIVADTYRWREHCGPSYDNDLGYRTMSEFKDWEHLCPVKKFREHLISLDFLSDDIEATLTSTIETEI
ncbi:MAG: thiamine pyrophosphate-dependent dehydrogenase E1 component subunit alpha, partial [Dehalococcoidales bacterium]|nr:thiamine pyrophosphate-dependent dehydrogenase E1 component subunit alpha [Dehalococcoidales bacterium]